jgi:xylulokinase
LRAFQEATVDPGLLEGVQALAVGGQQHGMVTLDESGELVRDALLWNDNRSAQSVAVGAAKQAAWALSGTMLDWPVPYASEQEPTLEDVAAAQEINARYESVLQTHFLDAGE